MKPRPSPTSPAAQLSAKKAEEVKDVWQNGQMQQPLKTPWGRLIVLVIVCSAVIGLGLLAGLGLYVHRYPQSWIVKYIPVSSTSTTVIQQNTKDTGIQVPTAVQAVQASGMNIARNQGKDGVYSSNDTSGYAWELSTSGWLMSINGAWPSDATSNVLVPSLGAVLPVTSQLSDPATPYRFLKTSSLNASPVTFADPSSVAPGAKVWVVTPEMSFARQIVRLITPHWQSSDRQESYWLLDAPTNAFIGAAVTDGEGRLLGLLGNDGRVWSLGGMTSAVKSIVQSSTLNRPIAGFTAADLSDVAAIDAPATSGWLIGATDPATAVAAKGPADKAGLKSGDRITAIDGQVPTLSPFLTMNSKQPNDSLQLTVIRDGKEKTLTLKLATNGS